MNRGILGELVISVSQTTNHIKTLCVRSLHNFFLPIFPVIDPWYQISKDKEVRIFT